MKPFDTKPKHSGAGDATTLDALRAFWGGVRLHKVSMFFVLLGVVLARVVAVIIPTFYKQFFDTLNLALPIGVRSEMLVKIIIYIFALNAVLWFGYRFATFATTHFESMVIAK